MNATLMRAAELLREDADARCVNYGAGDVFVPISQRDAVEARNSVATGLVRMAQAEPAAHLVAMSNGDDDAWFEVADGDGEYDFAVYAAPRLPRDVLMAVAREVHDATWTASGEGWNGEYPDNAESRVDLDAIVDRHVARAVFAKDRLIAFVEKVSKQRPEKPDYWSECGQCERNAGEAEDLLAAVQEGGAV